MSTKKTMVLGASTNPTRYSNRAVKMLKANDIETVAIGIREGSIDDVIIDTKRPVLNDIHTVTLYLNPERQKAYYDYILELQPKRIIFNPGTENVELMQLAKDAAIETEIACTLVLLSIDNY